MKDNSYFPRYALFRDRRVRVVGYEDGKFKIVDTDDTTRTVLREQLVFRKGW